MTYSLTLQKRAQKSKEFKKSRVLGKFMNMFLKTCWTTDHQRKAGQNLPAIRQKLQKT